jgi:hypothetical protein
MKLVCSYPFLFDGFILSIFRFGVKFVGCCLGDSVIRIFISILVLNDKVCFKHNQLLLEKITGILG